jgi:hypothetical protein
MGIGFAEDRRDLHRGLIDGLKLNCKQLVPGPHPPCSGGIHPRHRVVGRIGRFHHFLQGFVAEVETGALLTAESVFPTFQELFVVVRLTIPSNVRLQLRTIWTTICFMCTFCLVFPLLRIQRPAACTSRFMWILKFLDRRRTP